MLLPEHNLYRWQEQITNYINYRVQCMVVKSRGNFSPVIRDSWTMMSYSGSNKVMYLHVDSSLISCQANPMAIAQK
jgi:hypothetical protein